MINQGLESQTEQDASIQSLQFLFNTIMLVKPALMRNVNYGNDYMQQTTNKFYKFSFRCNEMMMIYAWQPLKLFLCCHYWIEMIHRYTVPLEVLVLIHYALARIYDVCVKRSTGIRKFTKRISQDGKQLMGGGPSPKYLPPWSARRREPTEKLKT